MKSASVPHPFDSHPPLPERMKNVGCELAESEFGGIAAAVPAAHWVTGIRTADEVEQRLWAAYEQRFAAVHEQSLAYRYEPANEAERAIVLKYFPDVAFALKGGKTFGVTYAGPVLPERGEPLSWNSVANLKYEDGSFSADVLTIEHPEKGWLGAKTTKVKLPGLGKQKERFKAILGHYWQRHQVMRNARKE